MKVDLTGKNVKLVGRAVPVGEDLLLGMSGSGVEFEYDGEGFELSLVGGEAAAIPGNEANRARIAVYVDGIRHIDAQLRDLLTVLKVSADRETGSVRCEFKDGSGSLRAEDISEDASRGVRRDPYLARWCRDGGNSHIFRIIKLSEAVMSVAMIKPFEIKDGENVRPVPELPLKIEFIGDSITCGYGVDDPDPLHLFKTSTEDVTKAYAYKTAAGLNADYSMFCASGWGIISGWTDDPKIRHDEQLIPDYYVTAGLSYDRIEGMAPSGEIPWDFGRFVPDIIVINLGTNDDSYTLEDSARQQQFAELYADFLETVRKHNPDAHILCVLGLMGDRLYPYVCRAVEIFTKRTGDTAVSTVRLPEQDGNIGYVCDYHPLESAHTKASEVMKEAINVVR